MVQESVQIRRQGAYDFKEYYTFACTQQKSVPLTAVKMHLDKGILDFNGDRVKLVDWPPILESISINKHLCHIAISSTYQTSYGCGDADRRYYKPVFRKKIPSVRSRDMTFRLCKALKECLSVSPCLKTLKLNGLPLRERDLVNLTKGLAKSSSLEAISLANCPIADGGLEVICQSVKYSKHIKDIDFTACNITWRGAEHLANIIQHQGIQRHGSAWEQSLRYQQPKFEGMGGLRRLTLNCNTLIGDQGAVQLARELAEDLWLRAVDMQKCGLSNRGASHLLEALKTNAALCVLDIRNNPLVDNTLIKTIIEKVLMRADTQSREYGWITPATKEPLKASASKRRVLSQAAAERTAPEKMASLGDKGSIAAQYEMSTSSSRNVPRHSAARAGRQRGFPPVVPVTESEQHHQGQAGSNVKVTFESDSEEEEDDGNEEEGEAFVHGDQRPSHHNLQDSILARRMERMQMALQECRLRLGEERRARLKAESGLREFELENARLRDNNRTLSEALSATGSEHSTLENEDVLESIERSFSKFHAFLDLVKDAGLGQLASMADIDTSDFPMLGRPQLSSPLGHVTHLDRAASSGHRSILTLGADITKPKSPSSVIGSVHRDGPLDRTFQLPGGAQVQFIAMGERDTARFSKPETKYDSVSECSFASQKPLHETPGSRPNSSHSGSHQSNVSHGSASLGRWGAGDLRRDIVSDKASLPGSRRLVVIPRSGSEGKASAGRDLLKEIRSQRALQGRSDGEYL
ncbi:centrosomal protein of 78 kDa isoform X2 [Entelurus aequoreus]|uniref:centrosomal protein of 78 kDa isoform X2 n=1 Tax=Entelurus aequoreus TaxID=161455 RepID=UPI002B1E8AF8|nr:centrosomal protein of 78 kDa isoform X2 [Entelurus aequoreus]